MSARSFLRVLRRDRLVLALLLLGGLAAGALVAALQPPEYEAIASSFVSTIGSVPAANLHSGSTFATKVAASYADVATRPIVLDRVIQQLRLRTTAPRLGQSVRAVVPDGTAVIRISASSGSGAQAARIANAVASTLPAVAEALSPQPSTQRVRITAVERASVPSVPTLRALPLDLLVGFAAGLVLAAGVLLVRERAAR